MYQTWSSKVAPVTEKMKGNRLSWYGHVMRRDDTHVTNRVMGMNVDGRRVMPKKRWMDCVTNGILEKGVDDAMTANREDWKKMTYCVDPK